MIIKSLKLENFRQFVGSQTINFSTNCNKKATLVIAENTTGKTTLIESFSWIFYGNTKLKTILNTGLKDSLLSNQHTFVNGEVNLVHFGHDYLIKRTQKFFKNATSVVSEDSILTIESKDNNGISTQTKGIDADNLISQIVPPDLFSYFFFKGENIEKIGKEFSQGKSGSNKEFVRAIRGMLGFNWLYQTNDDLNKLLKKYRSELANNNCDKKLTEIMQKFNNSLSNKEKYESEISQVNINLEKYRSEKKNVSEEIAKSVNVADKQKQAMNIEIDLKNLQNEIKSIRKEIFSKFSDSGFQFLGKEMLEETIETLKSEENIDKGIPGLDAKAVKYMLDNKKCICGRSLVDGSNEYKQMLELIKYLPPNNLGYEIKIFNTWGIEKSHNGENYLKDFYKLRKTYDDLVNNQKKQNNCFITINDEIRNYPDMSKRKAREEDLRRLIQESEFTRATLLNKIDNAKREIDSLTKEKANYAILDSHNKILEQCEWHVNKLIERISKHCEMKEKEKCGELELAINEIFSEVFDMDIKLELGSDYSIKLKSGSNTDLSDFENSTSQDAIMAFSFIGGIIKLARNKVVSKNSDDDLEDEDIELEPYPLVMDAPSSSFDIERIKNFCKVMPSIAEQVIFFIKDTDGLYVKNYLSNSIGKEYVLNKINKFETEIKEIN